MTLPDDTCGLPLTGVVAPDAPTPLEGVVPSGGLTGVVTTEQPPTPLIGVVQSSCEDGEDT